MKKIKRGETDGRESEHLVVPVKPGNLVDAGTRWREGVAILWNCMEDR